MLAVYKKATVPFNPLIFQVNMTEENYKNIEPKSGFFVYFVTVALSSGLSFALATYWLELTPGYLAVLLGAVFGLIGYFILGEAIFDAIVFSFILCIITFIFIMSGKDIAILRICIVPITTGICVGKLVYGIREGL